MLESYVAARDHLLKPGGKMFPDHSVLYAAPFSDEALYSEQLQKSAFWGQVALLARFPMLLVHMPHSYFSPYKSYTAGLDRS